MYAFESSSDRNVFTFLRWNKNENNVYFGQGFDFIRKSSAELGRPVRPLWQQQPSAVLCAKPSATSFYELLPICMSRAYTHCSYKLSISVQSSCRMLSSFFSAKVLLTNHTIVLMKPEYLFGGFLCGVPWSLKEQWLQSCLTAQALTECVLHCCWASCMLECALDWLVLIFAQTALN